ncbi:MAG: cytochrome c [Hydrogenophaga sp.]|uniref:c-type cytochrome n=1 Tax=Hydrogenophaga sp. TaxID=1904254 RepID=UPI00271F1F57|nr:cytochrome c [Hydrogenophaga sp.]MDO9505825.1 cytochrome c [Hydrogenophaga sp.]MDP3625855.1 cytochrome c [Hydrogenophaga sp.]
MTRHITPWRVVLAGLLLGVGALVLAVLVELRGTPLDTEGPPLTVTPQLVERGAYLARAGNCMACHTERGGAAYAGGRAVPTPFGAVISTNLTPHKATGIGRWSAAGFWRALHHGQSQDGRLLYPAFPYNHTTLVTREDSDALFAFLLDQPAVEQASRPHALRFPYNTQAALALWRALYFKPGVFQPEPTQSAEWNRGAYLTRGLAHCAACHAERDALGGSSEAQAFRGGLMPAQDWYAPSLRSASEGGVAGWDTQQVVALLKTGVAEGASVMGPMADVVLHGTQHLNDADLRAMAVYLQALPHQAPKPVDVETADPQQMVRGEKLYAQQCAQCHGDNGEGAAGVYPRLAGNRAVTLVTPHNVVQAILGGGFAPATAGHPRPYGMPPYRTLLTDEEVAAVASFVRQSWGNQAPAVSGLAVQRLR